VLHDHPNPEDVGAVVPAPLRFSPDGRWLATVSDDNLAHLWYLRSEHPTANHLVLAGHDDAVVALAFDDSGHWLVTGGADRTVRAWDLRSLDTSIWPRRLRHTSRDRIAYRPLLTPHNPKGGLELIRFNSSGTRIALSGEQGKRELWRFDPTGGASLEHWFQDEYPVMSSSGRWLLNRKRDANDELVDLLPGGELVRHALSGQSSSWRFSEGDQYLIRGHETGAVQLWRLGDRPALLHEARVAYEEIDAVDVTPSGHRTVAVTRSRIFLQQRDRRGVVTACEGLERDEDNSSLVSVALSVDGHALLMDFSRVLVRRGGSWRSEDLPTGPGEYRALALGLFLRARDTSTQILELEAHGRWRLHDVTEAVGYCSSSDYHVGSRLLALSTEREEVCLFKKSRHRLELLRRLPPRAGHITALAVSPWAVAIGEVDGSVHVWRRPLESETQEIVTVGRHRGEVRYLNFSPDGRWLASGGADNEACLHPLDIAPLLESAVRAVGRSFASGQSESTSSP
jgi:WD40 repeat protein